MIYKKYGEVFKKLRLQHHLLLSDFERVGLSKSTLSYFENGKSMISLDKLDPCLTRNAHDFSFLYADD
ncbi:hypothetical protein LG21E20_08690 [Lactococcus formosensis]|nr:helix-turn-helix transcriptional regulator [Lactococcus formosensis]BAV01858.1 Helix-turn-helix domain protein [Lactococcus formosensis]BDW49207.1 hypothetical protein LG21E20_08690 [Lactococcus formosensis]BDX24790.1 hypothetical protein LFMS200408A_08670 [Lactococcus formosensis]